jgi:hypothetical protein
MPASDPLIYPPFVEKVLGTLPPDQKVFLVGGAVRDLLLGQLSRDFDFTVNTGGIVTARKVANALHADFYPLGYRTGYWENPSHGGGRYSICYGFCSIPRKRS